MRGGIRGFPADVITSYSIHYTKLYEDATIAEVGWDLFRMILDVASGRRQVAADRLGLHNDLVLFNPGPVT